jgi:hypothetical protein
VGPPLLQFPDAAPHPAEAAVGLRLPLALQVASSAQRQVHALVEVVTGFAVATLDLLGHMGFEEPPRVLEEGLIVGRQLDS